MLIIEMAQEVATKKVAQHGGSAPLNPSRVWDTLRTRLWTGLLRCVQCQSPNESFYD